MKEGEAYFKARPIKKAVWCPVLALSYLIFIGHKSGAVAAAPPHLTILISRKFSRYSPYGGRYSCSLRSSLIFFSRHRALSLSSFLLLLASSWPILAIILLYILSPPGIQSGGKWINFSSYNIIIPLFHIPTTHPIYFHCATLLCEVWIIVIF